MEYQLGDVPWIDDIISSPIPINKGYLEIPERSGPGIELNKKEVASYLA